MIMADTVMWSLLIGALTVHQSSIVPAEAAINYDFVTHICCNGTVAPKDENTACCGKTVYDFTKFLCCATDVVPLPEVDPDNIACCFANSGDKAKPFSIKTHTCCDGEILAHPANGSGQRYGCCSGKLYNYPSQICCDDKVHTAIISDACCGGKIYNDETHVCCEDSSPVGADSSSQSSYSEILERKGNNSFCCGKTVYDQSEEACCDDEIRPKPEGIELGSAGCCGKEVYDYTNHICCESLQNISGEILPDVRKVHAKNGDDHFCCGAEVYDYLDSFCCGDTILPKLVGTDKNVWGSCCGDKIMTNFKFQLCINDELVVRNSTAIALCGNESKVFNVRSQTCCMDEVLDDSSDQGCCFLASKTYNKKTENCCGDEILPMPPGDLNIKNLACCKPN